MNFAHFVGSASCVCLRLNKISKNYEFRTFYPRNASSADISCRLVYVCLSVRVPQVGVLPKRLNAKTPHDSPGTLVF